MEILSISAFLIILHCSAHHKNIKMKGLFKRWAWLISVFVSVQRGLAGDDHSTCFPAVKVFSYSLSPSTPHTHTHTSSIIDVGDEAPEGSSPLFIPPISPSCSWLSPAHLLLSFFCLLAFHFTPPSPAFHLVHPFTCLLALFHLMCCRRWGLPARFQQTTHSKMELSFTSFSVCPLPVYSCIYICISAQIHPPPQTHEHTQNPHFAICTQTHTYIHTLCSLSLLLSPLRGFYHTVPRSLSRC